MIAGVLAAAATRAEAHSAARSSFEARPAVSAAGPGLQVVFSLDAQSLTDLAGGPIGPGALAYLDARFLVSVAGALCPREAPRSFDQVGNAVILDVVYRCAGRVTVESTLFHDEWIPHEVIGTIHHAGRADRYFFTRGERTQSFEVVAPRVGGFRTATPPPGAFRTSVEPAPVADAAALPPLPSERDRDDNRARLLLLTVLGAFVVVAITRRSTRGADPRHG